MINYSIINQHNWFAQILTITSIICLETILAQHNMIPKFYVYG